MGQLRPAHALSQFTLLSRHICPLAEVLLSSLRLGLNYFDVEMNRVQYWLLLVLGLILAGTATFWLTGHAPAPALTAVAPAASESPVSLTEITRRHPNMLVMEGKAPASADITLRLSGQKVGEAKADSSGAFQLTTSPLPRDEKLNFTLQLNSDQPLGLFVIDRRPQLITLLNINGHYQPLQRPRNGAGILLTEWLEAPRSMRLTGQADTGTTIYAYANDQLIGKTTTSTAAIGKKSDPVLFTLQFDNSKWEDATTLRIDMMDATGKMTSRTLLDFDNKDAWQAVSITDGSAPFYIWRDLAAQQADVARVYPGQFTPLPVEKAANPSNS